MLLADYRAGYDQLLVQFVPRRVIGEHQFAVTFDDGVGQVQVGSGI
jgi:hypothetical protein